MVQDCTAECCRMKKHSSGQRCPWTPCNKKTLQGKRPETNKTEQNLFMAGGVPIFYSVTIKWMTAGGNDRSCDDERTRKKTEIYQVHK